MDNFNIGITCCGKYVFIKEQTGKKLIYHFVITVSDKLGIHTRVQWPANLYFFSWINEKIHEKGKIENNLTSLKQYIENPLLYNGSYSGIIRAHKALQQYIIIDKSLKKIALSYEKFDGDRLPPNDSGDVKVEICYPVF